MSVHTVTSYIISYFSKFARRYSQAMVYCPIFTYVRRFLPVSQLSTLSPFRVGYHSSALSLGTTQSCRKKEAEKVILTSSELSKYIDKGTTSRKMKDQVINLLADWKGQQKEHEKPEK